MNTGKGMKPVHLGEAQRDEIDEAGLLAGRLSKVLGVPTNRVTAILNCQRGVNADTALRLARDFGTTLDFRLNLPTTWELRRVEIAAGRETTKLVAPRRPAAAVALAEAITLLESG